MIRRITDVSSPLAQTVLRLRQQFLTEHPHELSTPMEQLVSATMQGLFHVLSLELVDGVSVGFAVLHPYHWGNMPVLWLDEVYIEPGFRGRGLFEQFINWCGHYCEVSGVPTMMTTVWTKAEGAPFTSHVGADPVALTLRMTNPVYRATYSNTPGRESHEEHTDPDPGGNGEQQAPRKKPRGDRRVRPKPHRVNDSESLEGKTSG